MTPSECESVGKTVSNIYIYISAVKNNALTQLIKLQD